MSAKIRNRLGIYTLLQVPISTLMDRAKGCHDTRKNSSAQQQLLTPGEEQALVEWIELHASMGTPFSFVDLHAEATTISGKKVGKQWHVKFQKCFKILWPI